MSLEAVVGAHSRECSADPGPKPSERLRAGGVHHEIIPQPVELADEIDGIESKAGGILPNDGGIDANSGARGHPRTPARSGLTKRLGL